MHLHAVPFNPCGKQPLFASFLSLYFQHPFKAHCPSPVLRASSTESPCLVIALPPPPRVPPPTPLPPLTCLSASSAGSPCLITALSLAASASSSQGWCSGSGSVVG